MLRKYKDFQPYWKTSKFDGIIWAVTCFSTILLDVVSQTLMYFIHPVIRKCFRVAT